MGDSPKSAWKPTRRRVVGAAAAAAVGLAAGGASFFFLKRRRPNFVFIISDALRADMLGRRQPGGAPLTPFLDAAAARGTRFEKFVSPSSWTLPSVAGVMSSRNPVVTTEYYGESYAAGATTFPKMLKDAGYFTFAIVKNPWLPARDSSGKLLPTVVTDGFEFYDVHGPKLVDNPLYAKGIGNAREVVAFHPAEDASDEAASVLAKARAGGNRQPFLLYLHYMNTHQPYSPSKRFAGIADEIAPPVDGMPDHLVYQVLASRATARDYTFPLPASDVPLVERAKALYTAATASVDAAVAQLAEALSAAGELENTVFIFTSDHGEEFGERGRCGHSVTLYQEVIHVPLVVWGPSIPRGMSTNLLRRGVDIAPAVLKLASIEPPADFEGEGLGLSGHTGEAEAVSCTVSPALPRELDSVTLSLVEAGGLKLIQKRPPAAAAGDTVNELYDLASDPGETKNLAEGSTRVAALSRRLQRYYTIASWRPVKARHSLDKDTEDLLKSLGYFH